jgi:hypothetical protein
MLMSLFVVQMTALKSANKELKGMMKTVRIEDVDVSLLTMSFLRIVSASVGFSYQFVLDFVNMIIFSLLTII